MCVFMSQPVCGTIVNYRIGIRTQMPKYCLIQILGENYVSKAGQLIGRRVVLNFGKKRLIGRVMDLHGRRGVVKVRFHKGIPGQALGAKVEILA